MNFEAVLSVVQKGISLIPVLIEAGEAIAPAIKVLENVVSGAKSGTITDEELTANEAALDQMIADFNEPLDDDED